MFKSDDYVLIFKCDLSSFGLAVTYMPEQVFSILFGFIIIGFAHKSALVSEEISEDN